MDREEIVGGGRRSVKSLPQRAAAWAVHAYTALGAPLALVALVAIAYGRYAVAFWCMVIATLIDSTDGMLARRFRVKEVLPNFDGARLDDIVDYLNYVVVPLVLAYHAGIVPHGWVGLLVAGVPLIASGYGFCQTSAKTSDHFFTGFPSYWNIVVLYLYVLGWPTWVNVAWLLGLSVLVFVPIRYLYPSRNRIARKTTYALGIVWAVLVFTVVAQMPTPSREIALLSLFFPAYYVTMSFWLHFRLPRSTVAA
jgi:phosphatidylcholine synthase